MSPQPRSTKTGTQQFDEMYGSLRNSNIIIKTIWIQIPEDEYISQTSEFQMTSPQNWYSNVTYNLNFVNGILTRASQYSLNIGIYTSGYDWHMITADGEAENLMLWYWYYYGDGPTNESSANYNDFVSFGGWSTPSAKQFGHAESVCGVTANRDICSLSIPARSTEMGEFDKSGQITVGDLRVGRVVPGKAQIKK
ncbi:hypothetical protein ANCDUO_10282 [Ancylostoma duodenale]|uniref:Uncharacterized protein n=1 Tax=Ancylostoma duodenale TaxID=51022 RepID=A0A0C2GE72_9BILA|nr:hypothetical protein ANCDUO_10282 [Ancylostoma duodenale]